MGAALWPTTHGTYTVQPVRRFAYRIGSVPSLSSSTYGA